MDDKEWDELKLIQEKLHEALDKGADEAIMMDMNGFISEGSGENIFIVKDGIVLTPTTDHCLNGITRQKVIEICKLEGIPIFEKNFSLVEVYGADEVFLTGTFGAQVPVGLVDGRPIGNGLAGDITKRIRSAYFDLIEKNTQC